MRRNKLFTKFMNGALAFLVAACMIPVTPVLAASSYTVTYRPGEVGSFSDAQKLAERYSNGYPGVVTKAEVTEKGAVKLTVAAGSDVPVAPQADEISASENYFVKNTSEWGPSAGEKVTKNLDYVVDYGKLINGVEYTVRFVDSESGESIAPSSTIYGNIGSEYTYTAASMIVNSDYAKYALVGEATQKLTLKDNAADNVMTFTYSNTYDPGTQVVENVVTVGGGTVEEIQTNIIYVGGTAVPGGGAAQGGGGAGGAQAGGEEGGQEGEVVIPDNETPLEETPSGESEQTPSSESQESGSGETVNIPEDETPLSQTPQESPMNMAVVAAVIVGVAAVAALIIWLQARKKRAAGGSDDGGNK